MTCRKCERGFKDGQHVMAQVLTVYRDAPVPHGTKPNYCIERPYAALFIEHILCDDND